jgi:hypothetical protein
MDEDGPEVEDVEKMEKDRDKDEVEGTNTSEPPDLWHCCIANLDPGT